MCEVLFAQIHFKSLNFVSTKQEVSLCLCADSSINKVPLCCRFTSMGISPKTQLCSVWKQGLFWTISPAMAMGSLAQFTLFLDLGLYPALCSTLLEWIPSNTQLKQALNVYSPSLPLLWLQCKCTTNDLADGRGKLRVSAKYRTRNLGHQPAG